MTCRLWETESDDYYYAIIFGHAHFEPFMPTLTYAFNYDKDRGGELVVNGKVVEYSHEKRILALDPFGELQEITLSEADMKIVGTHQCDQIWESIVLQRLYQFTGRTNNGKRVGPWTCSDMDGNKAYEGDFLEDRRDGKWTYYYRSGGVRAILHYQNGTRHGKWTYFGEDGAQTDVLTWNNDIPLERSVGHYGMCFSEVCHPKAKIVERHED
jgi:hypothetical protein